MIAVRKSLGLKNQSRQLATPDHVIFAYDIVQRCLSLLVWILGLITFYVPLVLKGIGCQVRCYGCTSIFRGVGLIHAFNESVVAIKWPETSQHTEAPCTRAK